MKLLLIPVLLLFLSACGREELSEGRMQDVGYSDGYAAGFNLKCGEKTASEPKSDDGVYLRYFKVGFADGNEACLNKE